MRDLIIVGASNAAREVLQIVKDINKVSEKWFIKGFIADSGLNIESLTNNEYKILGTIKDWMLSANEDYVCAIAEPKGRKKVVNYLQGKGAKFVNIIHPTVKFNDYCKIGEGNILYPGSSLGANSEIGDFIIIQKTDIAHDVVIGSFTTVSALCGILGNVKIGKEVFIGNHVTILPKLKIEDKAFIGAGSVVIRNVKSGIKVFGNPAKIIDF